MEAQALEDDACRPSLVNQAAAGLPLFVPWSKEKRQIGTAFESRDIYNTNGPWKGGTVLADTPSQPLVAVCELEPGATMFKQSSSESSDFHEEHMSGSLGIAVGCPFASASVTGTYDHTVTTMGNATRISKNVSIRRGRIILEGSPTLSPAARALMNKSGPAEFRKEYGDYYVAGYELGAESGACMAVETSSTTTVSKESVTVTVKVLFWTASATVSTTEVEKASEFALNFCSYDTLAHETVARKSDKQDDAGPIFQSATDALHRVECMEANLTERLSSSGLTQGRRIGMQDCSEICGSGLVTRLILKPFSTLLDYGDAAEMEAREAEKDALDMK